MTLLINEIKSSLEELELGLKGDLNMTEAMEKLAESLSVNRVPSTWSVFYFNKKPLASWYQDMKNRYN
jgi:dynein heavy chain, axonemal